MPPAGQLKKIIQQLISFNKAGQAYTLSGQQLRHECQQAAVIRVQIITSVFLKVKHCLFHL